LIPEPETELEEIEIREGPLVAVVMGAESDRGVMAAACDELKERGISFEANMPAAPALAGSR
jgi:phosphoribosylcarboxyaminoimidazole (NCAIR) mutase